MRLFSGLLHLIFACVPGCGQMYQGYMKRGISQTVLVSIALFFAILLENGALSVLIVPLWMYSFFDSFNLRRQWKEGYAQEDEYMFGLSDMDYERFSKLIRKRGSFIGWVLVVIGLYNLYQVFARRFFGFLRDLFPWLDWLYGLLVWDMPRIMVTVLVIAIGMWFIRGPKAKPDDLDFSHVPPRRSKPEAPPQPKPSPWTKAEQAFHEEPEPQAPDVPDVPEVPVWESEFEVEKFEKAAQEEDAPQDGGKN